MSAHIADKEFEVIAKTLLDIVDSLSDEDMEKVATILIGAMLSSTAKDIPIETKAGSYIS